MINDETRVPLLMQLSNARGLTHGIECGLSVAAANPYRLTKADLDVLRTSALDLATEIAQAVVTLERP